MIGQTLGHYRVLEQIGAGGMGVVYRAHDERLDRDVALKVLPTGTLADESARKRFRKEALTLSKLNHPNIETVFDFDTQDGVDFLAMELITGITLDQKLLAGALPEKEVLRLGQQLAEGLTAAHEQGVIHRDLKPGNLRLTPDGRLKILDFGLAKLLQPVSEVAVTASVTETHAVTGTLPYMAPEQLRGEAADARSDIWAAGAVLYEMATGRRPFDAKLSTVLAGDIQHKAPPFPRQLKPELSPKLEDLILKCLEKDPDNRYQSARELAVDLRRLAAPAAETQAVAPQPMKRSRKVLAASLAVPLALAAAIAIGNLEGVRDRLLGRSAASQTTSIVQSARRIDPDAHEAYLRGFNHLQGARRDYEKARQSFESALLIDPNYALAYAGLADTYLFGAMRAEKTFSRNEALLKGKVAALRALESDPTLAGTHVPLAMIKQYLEWDWAGADVDFRRAVQLNPGDVEAHLRYATYLSMVGRHREAIDEARRAEELDPLSRLVKLESGWPYLFAGDHDRAIQIWTELRSREPGYTSTYKSLGLGHLAAGRYAEAKEELAKAIALEGDFDLWTLTPLARAHALLGNKKKVVEILDQLHQHYRPRPVPAYALALIYTSLGENEQALTHLEEAYKERSADLPYLNIDPGFKLLRSDPRFQDLLRRMNFPP